MSVEHHDGFVDNVVGWLHEGYPHGVPPKDYFPLLALLMRSLTEEEVVKAARTIVIACIRPFLIDVGSLGVVAST